MLIAFLAIVLCAFQGLGVEAVKVYFEDFVILEVDPKYIDPDQTVGLIVEDSSSDENTITTKLTLRKKLPAEAQGRFLLTGMSMGKYTVPTGVDLTMQLCDMLDEPIVMGPFFAVLGFTKESCPPEPGIYAQEGYKLPTELLPDEFPENKYLVYVDISLKGKSVVAVHIYANLQTE